MLGEKVIASPPTLFSPSDSLTKTDHISPALKVDAGLNKNTYISDVYCNEMTSPLSITRKTKDHDVPFILPINRQADLSRSIRPNSEKKEQQFHSFVNINSSAVNPINKNLQKNSAPNPIQHTTQHNTRINIDVDNQIHISHIYNTNCTQNETPSPK